MNLSHIVFIPFLRRQKAHAPARQHRYAILIAARNEEKVIGDLDTEKVPEFESGLTAYAYENAPELCRAIDGGAKLDNEQIDRMRQVIQSFKRDFTP